MHYLRRLILTIGSIAILVIAWAGAATAAPADRAGTTASAAQTIDGREVDSADAAKEVSSYWSLQRMRQAIPVPVRVAGLVTSPEPDGPPGTPGSSPPAEAIASAADSLAGGDRKLAASITESSVAGKVFFHKPSGGDWVCSASALNSPSKQLVITAGHCVHEGRGGSWVQNWTFVPRYRSGARPFGVFAAKRLRTFDSWISSSDPSRDVGMVTTWPLNGNKLVNVTGGHGLNWNFPKSTPITILAYPRNANNGEIQQRCQGTSSDGGGGAIQLHCNFNGGSSGGGWLMSFNDSTGLGQVDGVMSQLDSRGWNRASYFDDAVKTMFETQGSVT